MAKVKTKIELTEDDILALVAEKYNLKLDGASVRINHLPGNQREPEQNTIIIEAEKAL